ncbi:MAG: polyhydroxyalkanoate depolymerase, partial [Burkholderiales bacterium]
REFYEEYFAMADLPAEFYLQTVERIFQKAMLATRELTFQGRRVDCDAVRRTALLTIEGEKDDICGVGQTVAAQELCGSIPPFRRAHHVQTGVGHYGVFNGRRWESSIYPIVRDFVFAHG